MKRRTMKRSGKARRSKARRSKVRRSRKGRLGKGRKRIPMTRERSKSLKARRKTYRKRIKRNTMGCRGKGPASCRGKAGCKYTKGKKRNFCRRSKNAKKTLSK